MAGSGPSPRAPPPPLFIFRLAPHPRPPLGVEGNLHSSSHSHLVFQPFNSDCLRETPSGLCRLTPHRPDTEESRAAGWRRPCTQRLLTHPVVGHEKQDGNGEDGLVTAETGGGLASGDESGMGRVLAGREQGRKVARRLDRIRDSAMRCLVHGATSDRLGWDSSTKRTRRRSVNRSFLR